MKKLILTSKKTGRQKEYLVLEIDRKKEIIKVMNEKGYNGYFWIGRDDIKIIDKD